MTDVKLTITGLQEAQAANLRMIAEVKPSGALGRAVKYALTELHRHAVAITHVDTGSLRASHRMRYEEAGASARGEIYIDPAAVNPRTHKRPAEYGVYEHDRGGSHAFYDRTRDEAGPKIEREMAQLIEVAVMRAAK